MVQNSFSNVALTEARIARGFTKSELAERVGISRQALTALEKGSEPLERNLSKIAEVLDLPYKYFITEPLSDFKRQSPVFFRKLSTLTDTLNAKASVKTKWHYSAYLELTKYLKKISPDVPKFWETNNYDVTKLGNDDLEDYAEELRKYWGLGLGAIIGLIPLFEKKGIIVFQFNTSKDIKGFSFYANNTPFVVCSSMVTAAKNRFSLAHEISHLTLHADLEENELLKYHKRVEEQANYFAGAFLFPKKKFYEEFFSTNIDYLTQLKRKWGISIGAIIQRACNLGLLTPDDVTYFYRRNAGIRRIEPLDKEMKIEKPTFQQNGLKAILDADILTIDDLKSNLPFNNQDLAEIFYQDKYYFEPSRDSEPTNIIELKAM